MKEFYIPLIKIEDTNLIQLQKTSLDSKLRKKVFKCFVGCVWNVYIFFIIKILRMLSIF